MSKRKTEVGTRPVTINEEPGRLCLLCRRSALDTEPDPCLGYLPGVKEACCGHGAGKGYILFKNRIGVRFNMLDLVKVTAGDKVEGLVLKRPGDWFFNSSFKESLAMNKRPKRSRS